MNDHTRKERPYDLSFFVSSSLLNAQRSTHIARTAVPLRLLHVKQRDEDPRRNDQRRTHKGEGADGLSEGDDPDEHTRDGLEGAEDGGSAAADEERPPLEQCDRARVDDAGKAHRQDPSAQGMGERQLTRKQAERKQQHRGDARHTQAEPEHRASFVLVGGQGDHVDGVGNARGERQKASLQVEGVARAVEQGDTRHAEQNAEDVLAVLVGSQTKEFTQHHHRRIDEVEHRGRARLDVVVGAEQKDRCQTAPHEGNEAQAGQGSHRHTNLPLAAERQQGDQRQGQAIPQEGKGDGVYAVGIDHACHQGHQPENDRAEDDTYVAQKDLFVLHTVTRKNCTVPFSPRKGGAGGDRFFHYTTNSAETQHLRRFCRLHFVGSVS